MKNNIKIKIAFIILMCSLFFVFFFKVIPDLTEQRQEFKITEEVCETHEVSIPTDGNGNVLSGGNCGEYWDENGFKRNSCYQIPTPIWVYENRTTCSQVEVDKIEWNETKEVFVGYLNSTERNRTKEETDYCLFLARDGRGGCGKSIELSNPYYVNKTNNYSILKENLTIDWLNENSNCTNLFIKYDNLEKNEWMYINQDMESWMREYLLRDKPNKIGCDSWKLNNYTIKIKE